MAPLSSVEYNTTYDSSLYLGFTAMPTLEERLSGVEKELALLRSQVEHLCAKENWIDQITGSFRDDPEFEEVLRLGREIRQADRPDAE